MKSKYRVEERVGKCQIQDGVSIPCLAHADLERYPYVIMTSDSVSVFGSIVCLCTNLTNAQEVLDGLRSAERKRKK